LTVNPVFEFTNSVSICEGENYTEGSSTYTVAGTYTDMYTSTSGCDSTIITVLNVNALPTGILSGGDQICSGDSAAFLIELTGNSPWVIEVINGTSIETFNSTTNSFIYSNEEAGTYQLELISDQFCSAQGQGSAELIVNPIPALSMPNSGLICEGSQGSLELSLDGTADFEIIYSVNGIIQDPIESYTNQSEILLIEAGNYEIISIEDAFCIGNSDAAATVEIVDLPTAEISGDFTICQNDTAIIPISLTGSQPWVIEYSINGIPENPVTTNLQEFFLTASQPGTYQITAINDQNCSGLFSGSATVKNYPPLTVSFSDLLSICQGESLILQAMAFGGNDAMYTYEWFNGELTQTGDSIEINPFESTDYLLTVTDACGTSVTSTIPITVHSLPNISIDVVMDEFCDAGVLQVNNTTPNEFIENCIWYINGDTISGCEQLNYDLIQQGAYDLELFVSSPEGCSNIRAFDSIAQVFPTPIANWEFNPESPSIIENGVQFIDLSSGATDYNWTIEEIGVVSNEPSPDYFFPVSEVGVSWFVCQEVSNQFGCSDQFCQPVVIFGELSVWVPNSFTPNGDGLNDIFKPVVIGADPSDYVFRIWDRYGHVLFESNEIGAGWDGQGAKNSNHYSQNGVYTWQLITKQIGSSNKEKFLGTVTLVR